MPADSLDDALDHLYSVSPEAFTAERDSLVKLLRGTDKEAAAAIKALRKPPVTAWALNQLVRAHPSDLTALVEADAALAQSQREGGGREALAGATAARREIIRRLVDGAMAALEAAGHPASPANRDRIAQTLASLAGDEGGREALLRGRLSGDLTPASMWEASTAAMPSGEGEGGAAAALGSNGEAKRPAAEAERLAAFADRARAHADRLTAEAARRAEEAERARIEAEQARAEADQLQAEAERAAAAAREAAG